MLHRIRQFFAPDKKSLASPDSDLLALFSVPVATSSGVSVGPSSALQVPAVACAVRAISEAAATLDVKVMRRDGETEAEVADHPVAGLLRDRVNDWTPGAEFIRDIVASALLYDQGGLAWVNRVGGRPVELIAYDPAHLKAQRHEDGSGAYRYQLNGREIPASEVIHLRSPFGRSPVTLARESIGLSITLEKHAAKLFGSGARPAGMVSFKERMTPDAIQKAAAAFRAMLASEKTGNTAFMDAGADYKQLVLSSVDSQFAELVSFQILQIARAFRVPPQMLYDLTRATWSNGEQMGREFLVYTLEPWLRALEGALRLVLFSDEEYPTHRVHFERDDLTRADLGTRATAYSTLISARVVNANEVRQWEGLAPYDGGDAFANPNTGSNQAGAAAPQADGGRPLGGAA
ncbi:phage portal protein [Xanthobacter sp. 126]|uniref:phage portal protein n=1 Tax=Xanthobacter sp. 126 TaxID=1131814 RepID=UPI00045E93C4|nr:phage portal protein [Xanthobacter sp. 126]